MTEIEIYNFNLIADDYNKHHYAHNNFIEIIRNYTEIKHKDKILDIGCGTGNETINLYKSFNCRVVGVEPAKDMLNVGKNNEDNIDWRIGSAENIPLHNNSADIITSFFSIHHFDNINLSFQEFYRVLKPKGKILIFSISHSQMESSLEYKFFPELLSVDLSRVPPILSLRESLSLNNFSTITIETEYETRKIDKKYLDMVKIQYRSGLRLLNQEQLRLGIKRIENSIENNENLVDKINCTVVIAQKQQPSFS